MPEYVIKFRRDNAADWALKNPILRAGEPGLEEETRRVKYGNGVSRWNDLPFSGEITEAELDEIIDQVREELEIPEVHDLVLRYENAKA